MKGSVGCNVGVGVGEISGGLVGGCGDIVGGGRIGGAVGSLGLLVFFFQGPWHESGANVGGSLGVRVKIPCGILVGLILSGVGNIVGGQECFLDDFFVEDPFLSDFEG